MKIKGLFLGIALCVFFAACGGGGGGDDAGTGTPPVPPPAITPSFSGTIADQNYINGVAITALPLPGATGRDLPFTYSITSALPAGLSFNSDTRVLSGTPTETGSITVTYRVQDADGDAQMLTFRINVAADTEPSFDTATIDAPDYINGIAITPLDLPEASGGNAPLEYSLSGQPAGLRLTGRRLVGIPAEEVSGQTATYTATDVDGDEDALTFMITVVANDAPDFGSGMIDDQSYIEGTEIPTLTLPVAASNGNGDSTYSIAPASPFGLTFNPSTRMLSGTPTSAGIETITYTVGDADGDEQASDEDTITFTIRVAANDAPDFGSETITPKNYIEGIAVEELELPEASGGNGALTYSIDPVSPFGLTFDPATRTLSGTPSGMGTQTVTYKAVDGDGDMTAMDESTLEFTITVAADTEPSFGTEDIDAQNYINGVAITPLGLPEATGGNPPLRYSLTGQPAGLSLTGGQLVGTPTEIVSGQTATYTATDANGDVATLEFTITVAVNDPPDFGSETVDAQSYIQGIAVEELELPAASGGNGDLSYSIAPVSPFGLTFNPDTRTLSGTPTGTGAQTVTYTVVDADGDMQASDTDTLEFTITVAANDPPDFGSETVDAQSYIEGIGVEELELPAASGGNGDLSYSIDPVSPFGLTFNPDTRTLSGTPSGTGMETVTYKAVDGDEDTQASDEATLEFTITVAANGAPGFAGGTMIAPQNYIEGIGVEELELPAASGGNGELSYSIDPVSPFGLTFNPDTRTLSGTPSGTGMETVTYKAVDGDGDMTAMDEATLEFTITVAADTEPSFGTEDIDAQNYINGVAITPLGLPEATGGNPPLRYSLTGQPAGLSLTGGQLVGTPTEIVSGQTATYTATDANGDVATLEFTITVAANDPPDFGSETVDAQSYIQGIAVEELELPAASGGNGDLSYSIVPVSPFGLTFNPDTRTLSGTPTGTGAQTVTYTVVDADGDMQASDTDTLEFTITVAANDPPDFGSETIDAQSYIEGIGIEELELPEASGGNGELSYSIAPVSLFGLTFNSDTRTLSGTPTGTGMETVTYKVVDADEDTQATDEDTLTFTITVAANDSPDFGSETIDVQSYIEGIEIEELELPEASGGNGALSYSIDPVSPFGLTFNSDTRTLSGTPTGMGMETVTYTVVDADGDMTATDEAALEFTINVAEDTEPGFDGQMIGDLQYVPNSEITPVTLPQASGGNPPLRYSLTTPPAGLTFNTGTRVLSGIPSATLGTTDMTYTVRDFDGDERTLTFTIEIIEDAVPGFAGQTIDAREYVENVAIETFALPVATGGNGNLTYSLAPLPDGILFNSGTRELSGSPTTVGSTRLTYTARDEDGDEEELIFTINVSADTEPSFDTATIDAPDYVNGIAITPLDLPEASGGNPPLRYSLTGQPAGLSLTGRQLVGTPSEEVLDQTATYTATDVNGDVATLTVMITVAANTAPMFADDEAITINAIRGIAFTTEPLPAAQTAGNGTSAYSVGSLPEWLTFTEGTRTLSGTPPSDAVATTILTYRVHDGDGDTSDGDSDTLTVTVNVVDNESPSFASGTTPAAQNYIEGITIEELELPAAMVGSGNGELSYSIDPVSPFGLTFDSATRRLSGTPAMTGGPQTITYKVVDEDGDMTSGDEDTLTFTITVIANDPPDFGSETIAAQSYIEGIEIEELQLPEATVGSGNGELNYSIDPESPFGLTFDPSTRRLSGTPAMMGGPQTVTYKVVDEDGDMTSGDEATLEFTITVAANEAPDFGTQMIDDQSYIQGVEIDAVILPGATGGNGNLEYRLPGLPDGIMFNSGTRELSGSPAAAGSTGVIYTVQDGDEDTRASDTDTLEFTITVAEDTSPMFDGTLSDQNYIENSAIEPLDLPDVTGGNAPLDYSIEGLPMGLELVGNQVTGTPTEVVTNRVVTYTVTDANDDPATLTFNITVAEDTEPSFGTQTISDQEYIIGLVKAPLILPEASGGNLPVEYSLTPLPTDELLFDSGTRELSGSPTTVSSAVLLTYTARDANGDTATLMFNVSVRAPQTKNICDRTQQVEEAILAKIHETNDLVTCDTVTELHLAVITTISIRRIPVPERLSSLQTDDFDGLSGLTDLDLGSNLLTTLPSDVFAGLSSLTTLDLGSNALTTLHEDVFAGLSSLTTLDLESNALRTLHEDVFAGLSSLTTLDLGSNALTTLHEDVFAGLSSLERLDLDFNALRTLPSDVFAGLSSLERLDLGSNALRTLPSDVFAGLSSLKQLFLSRNALSTLPSDVFAGLSSLTNLGLSRNGLSTLPSDVFAGLESLTDLGLGFNGLSTLPSDVFAGLESLTDLSLVFNDLTTLPAGIFSGLTNLRELDLNYNSFETVPAGVFNGLGNFQTLDLGYNKLTSEAVGTDFDSLVSTGTFRDLDLQYNRLSDPLPAICEDSKVDCSNNPDTDIAPSFGRLGIIGIAGQQYKQRAEITPIILPEARGGNGTLTYSIDPVSPFGLTFDPATRRLSGTPSPAGEGTVRYMVVDADGDGASITFTITVAANDVPSFGSETIADREYVQDVAITTLTLPAASGGNGNLTYSLAPLPDGILFNSGTRELSGSPTTVGSTRVTYTARDADGDEEELTFTINVSADTDPSFDTATIDAPDYINGIAITPLDLPEAMGGNPPLRYSLTGQPAGLSLTGGQLVGTPTEVVSDQAATYTATDVDGDVATLTVMITVVANDAPMFASGTTIGSQNYINGVEIEELLLPAAMVGSGNGELSYSIDPVSPFGLTFNSDTRTLSGTPSGTGPQTVTYTVVDADGDMTAADEDTLEFTITVAANDPPDFGSETIAAQSYIEGIEIEELELPEATVGSGNGELSYSIDPVSPFGLTFNPDTRIMSGTPSGTGPQTITYKAVDADGDMTATDEDTLQFTINVAEDTVPGFDGQMIESLQYVPNSEITPVALPEASGGNPPLRYSLTTPPAGLTFNTDTRVLSGIPSATLGTTDMTYTVRDFDGDETPLTFTIEIIENAVPGFAGQEIDDQEYVQNVAITTMELPEASGGNGNLTYSLAPLPDGILFNSGTRELSGSPTTVGSTSLTYTARDADGDEEELTFTINVSADTEPSFDTATIDAPDYINGIAITPLDLPEAMGGNPPLRYSLTGQPAGLNLTGRQLVGTPAEVVSDQAATYTATDVNGDVATLTVMITVAANTAPMFANDDAITINAVKGIEFTAEPLPAAQTVGNGASVYSVENRPSWLTFTAGTRELSGTPPSDATNITLTYRVHDGDGDTSDGDSDTLTVTVNMVDNEAPSFAAGTTIGSQNYINGVEIDELPLPEATVGSGNGELSYSIEPATPFGLTFNSDTRTLSGTPSGTGAPQTITYKVVDEDGDMTATDEDTLTFTITVAADTPPDFGGQTIAAQNYIEDTAIDAVILPSATGGNGALTYSLIPELPAGLTFDPAPSARTISGAPTVAFSSTEYTYTVTDVDGDSVPLMFNITVDANEAPSFASGTTIGSQNYVNGVEIDELELPEATVGSGNGELSYSIEPATPFGLMFNPDTRILSGTPAMTGGPQTVTYTVVDEDGDMQASDTATLEFTITVAANEAPGFAGGTTIAPQNYIDGIAIEELQLPEATVGSGNGDLSYSIDPATPFGLTFDPSTRRLSGTPSGTGPQTVTYKAVDGDGDMTSGDEATLEFTITVAANEAPSFAQDTAIAVPAINGLEFTQTLPDATGGNGALNYSIEGIVPSWLMFDENNRILSGTPDATGEFSVTYKVEDGDGDMTDMDAATRTVTINVAANEPPDFGSETIAAQSYIEGIEIDELELPEASGGNGELSYSIDPVSPFGLTFNSDTRTLSGTPTGTGVPQTITYKVVDADGDMTATDESTLQFTINVAEDTVPGFDGQMIESLQYIPNSEITPVALPEASGGNPPLRYSLTTPPAGLAFNTDTRVLSGIPSATLGITDMTYTVRDEDGDERTLTFTIEIIEDAMPGFAGQEIDDREYVQNIAITTMELPEATGGNGNLMYSLAPLPGGILFNSGTRELSGSPTTVGSTRLTYTARDEDGDEEELMFTINVSADTNPSFGSETIPAQNYIEDTTIDTLTLPEATGGNEPLTYSLTPELPAGLTFDPAPDTRTISGAPTVAFSSTEYTYTVTDADGDMVPLMFNITVAANEAPSFAAGTTIRSQNYINGVEIEELVLPEAMVGSGNGDLSYSIDPVAPFGLTFNSATRTLSGTPSGTGPQTVTYTVGDADGDTAATDIDTITFTITVAENTAPEFVSESFDRIYVNGVDITSLRTASTSLPVATGGNAPLEYRLTDLPAGLRLENGQLAGTPTETVTDQRVTYTVEDADGDTDTIMFNITVDADTTPIFAPGESIDDQTYVEGIPIRPLELIVATTGGNQPLLKSLTNLPAGLEEELDHTTGNLAVVGTPTETVTDQRVTYTVTDVDGDVATLTFNITVREPRTVSICDRTQEVQDAILDALRGSVECDAVTERQLLRVRTLDVSNMDITSLQENDLEHLIRLTNIHLQGNDLTTLPDNLFDGLFSLRDLNLSDNFLTTLPDNLFDDLSTSFGDLNLSNNLLTTLPAGIFDRMPNLQDLDLSDNFLTTLSENLFDSFTILQNLDLSNNDLTSIPSALFEGLSRVREIDLSSNYLTTLPAGIFDRMPLLQDLDLSFNKFTSTTVGTNFDSFVNSPDFGIGRNVGLDLQYNRLSDPLPEICTEDKVDCRNNPDMNVAPNFGLSFLFDNLQFIDDQLYKQKVEITPLILPEAWSGNGDLTYSIDPVSPFGLTFNPDTRTLSGTPAVVGVPMTVTYTAEDEDGDVATLTFTITVIVNDVPSFAASETIVPQSYIEGKAITPLDLPEAIGGDGNLSYSIDPESPFGLTFNPDTQTLSGIPAMSGGPQTVTYTVVDGDGDESTLMFTITVAANELPSFGSETIDDQQYTQNREITTETLPEAISGDQPLTYRLAPTADPGGMLPAGLSFNASTRELSGRPTAAGTTAMTYTVEDNNGDTDTITFMITVADNTAPMFDGTLPAQNYVENSAIQPLDLPGVTGGNAPLEYTIEGLPMGLQLVGNQVTGTPTEVVTDRVVTYTVTDADDDESTGTFSITVEGDLMPSFRTVLGFIDDQEYLQGSQITPLSLRRALGGNGPLVHSLEAVGMSGMLPGGFMFTDNPPDMPSLTGTPDETAVGLWEFIYKATDRDGDFDELRFEVLVVSNSRESTVDICSRTQQVQDFIVNNINSRLGSAFECGTVTEETLAIVRFLNLDRGGVTTLQEGDFNNLPNLRFLFLNHNELTALPTNVFSGLTNLRDIILNENEITTLDENMFSGLTNLRILNLGGNDLTVLPADLFDGLDALERLDLHNNDLTVLPADLFDGLESLERLDLRNNDLRTLPAGLFEGLTNLTTLDLRGNPLDGTPAICSDPMVTCMEDLRPSFSPGEMILDMNYIEFVPIAPVILPEASGGDGTLSYSLTPLGDRLSFNEETRTLSSELGLAAGTRAMIYTVEDEDGDRAELTFNINTRLSVEKSICDRTMAVQDAIIAAVEEEQGDPFACDEILEDYFAFPTLTVMSETPVSLQAGDFADLFVRTLNLSDIGLTDLPADVFTGLASFRLTRLDLSNNELTSLPAGLFDELTSLTNLNLSNNNLMTLPDGLFDELSSLTTLDLRGNPFATPPAICSEEGVTCDP